MATVTKPVALDESLNTTDSTPKNIADVLKDKLGDIASAISGGGGGSGGHTIQNASGTNMPQESTMQFKDSHVTDNSGASKTEVEVIKSVASADYSSETEDGLYLLPDGEGSVIEPASEDYVKVTADGVKTWGQLLNELFSRVDTSKITEGSFLKFVYTSNAYGIYRLVGNYIPTSNGELRYTFERVSDTTFILETCYLRNINSKIYSFSNNVLSDASDNTASGKLTLYYGNKKAVVDLQTTANRCLLTGGGTVQDALETESNHFTFQTSGYVNYFRFGKVVMLHIVKNAVPTNEGIGTLPVGFRPNEALRFRNYAGNGFAIVSSDGSVTLSDYESWCNTTCTYLTL